MPQDNADPLQIHAAISAILPPGVHFEGGAPPAICHHLYASELRLVENCVPQRRREFSAGRFYARRALSRLGHRPAPILVAGGRWPVWPAGIVGSISHCATFCGATVAVARDVIALGFDVEEDVSLAAELIPIICSPEELEFAVSNTIWPAKRVAKLIFSIKESVFKAYHPPTASFLDFREAMVTFDWTAQEFVARICSPERPPVFGRREITGRFGAAGGVVFSIASISSGII